MDRITYVRPAMVSEMIRTMTDDGLRNWGIWITAGRQYIPVENLSDSHLRKLMTMKIDRARHQERDWYNNHDYHIEHEIDQAILYGEAAHVSTHNIEWMHADPHPNDDMKWWDYLEEDRMWTYLLVECTNRGILSEFWQQKQDMHGHYASDNTVYPSFITIELRRRDNGKVAGSAQQLWAIRDMFKRLVNEHFRRREIVLYQTFVGEIEVDCGLYQED